MSYAFGTLLFYQAKNAISPEYEHQRKRDRRNKEGLDRNQANVAESIDTNVSGMMPNGDPAPKRDPKDKKRIIKVGKKVIIGLAIDRTYMELTNMKGLIVVISSFFLFYIDIWELLSYHYSEFYSPYI